MTVFEVCAGSTATVTFTDRTNLNCNTLPPDVTIASNINNRRRWRQFVYGGTGVLNTITGGVVVGGTPVATGTGLTGAVISYNLSGGAPLGSGGGTDTPAADPTYVTPPTPTQTLNIVVPATAQTGEEFVITTRYWNVCNRFDLDQAPVEYNLTRIRIVAQPPLPSPVNKEVCRGDAVPDFEMTIPVGGSVAVNWFRDNNGVPGTAIANPNGGNSRFLPASAYAPAGPLNTGSPANRYRVWASYNRTSSSLICESVRIPITITLRPTIPQPLDFTTSSGQVCNGATNVDYILPTTSPTQTVDIPTTAIVENITFPTEYVWQATDMADNPVGDVTLTLQPDQRSVRANFNIAGAFTSVQRKIRVFSRYTTTPRCNSQIREITITIFGVTQGGTVAPSPTICQGASTGTMTLSGQRGTVVRWERQFNGGGFNPIASTAGLTSFSEVPALGAGTYNYRAVVQNGVCAAANSTANTIVVNAVPPKPTISQGAGSTGLVICANGSDQTVLQSSNIGGLGVTFRWFRNGTLVQSGPSNSITLTTVAQSGDYTVEVVGAGPSNCTSPLSDPVTVLINPLPTVSSVTGGGASCAGFPAPDITFTFTGTTPLNFTVDVNPGTDIVVTNHPSLTFTIVGPNPGVPTTYSISALTDANGCVASSLGGTASVTIGGTPPALDAPFVLSPTATCSDGVATADPSLTFSLTPISTVAGTYILTYQIDGGANLTRNFTVNLANGDVSSPIAFNDAALNNTTPSPHVINIVSIQSPSTCLAVFNTPLNFTVNPRPPAPTNPVPGIACASGGGAAISVADPGVGFTIVWSSTAAPTFTPASGATSGARGQVFTPTSSVTATYHAFTRADLAPTNCLSNTSTPVQHTQDQVVTTANAGTPQANCTGTFTLAGNTPNAANFEVGTWTIPGIAYQQSFNYPNGTTTSAAINNWSLDLSAPNVFGGGSGYFRVESGRFEVNNADGGTGGAPGAEVVWLSPVLNISALSNVSVSVNLSSAGTEAGDYIRAFISVNGGAETFLTNGNQAANFGSATATTAGINGTTLRLIIRTNTNGADDFYRFDDILIAGTGAPTVSTNINDPTTVVSGLPVGTTNLTWTITSRFGVCPPSPANVTLTRHPLPVVNNLTPALCEDQPGGSATTTNVNLTTFDVAVMGGTPANTVVEYYSNSLRTPPFLISTPVNIINAQTIFTRVRNTTTTCTSDGTLVFTVRPLPVAVNQSYSFCEDFPGGIPQGRATGINLTSFNSDVSGAVPPATRSIEWYTDPSLIPASRIPVGVGAGEESNFTLNATSTIYAKVIDITNPENCFRRADVTLNLQLRPQNNPVVGNSTVCVDATNIILYQVNPTLNPLSTYTWTITGTPGAFQVFGGGGTNTSNFFVLLRFPAAGTVNISVQETLNGCVGNVNSASVTVATAPPANTIVGPLSVCKDENGVVYQVGAPNPLSLYTWSVTGATVQGPSSGIGLSQITLNFSSAPGAIISVTETSSSGCAGPDATVNVVLNDRPILNATTNTVCSDSPANITFTHVGAATFNITNVSVEAGLVPISRPTANGVSATAIANDVFTNTTGVDKLVLYTVVPVASTGCVGDAKTITLRVQPEPVLATNLVDDICSRVESVGITLAVATGSATADQYEITNINPNGMTAIAGNPTTGIFGAGELLDDRWVNTSGSIQQVEYLIRPRNSVTGCVGDPPVPVIVTVFPEPVVDPLPTETICSGDVPTSTITSAMAGASFSWTVNSVSGPIAGSSNGTGPSITNTLVNTGAVAGFVRYNIVATAPAVLGGCQSQSIVFQVNVEPAPVANNVLRTVCSDAPGGNTFLTDLTALQNSVNNTGGVTFAWFQDAALTTPIATPAAHTVTNAVPVFVEVDNGQCTKVATVTFTVNPSPSVTTSVTSNFNGFQISCTGASDGQITAVPANGTAPFQFSIDGGTTFFNSPIFNGLSVAGGPYVIRVRDTNGCIADSAPINFTDPPALSANAAITSNFNGQNVSCQAAADGQVTITPTGGAGGYTYRLLELPSNSSGDASGVYTGLRAGTYTFVVRDVNNCQFTLPTITLTEPPPVTATATLTSPVSCNGNADGSITVTGGGGTLITPNYTFDLIQAPFTSNTTGVFTGLGAGNYSVRVTDSNGCSRVSNVVTVTQPPALTVFASVTSDYNGAKISCFGANDAQVTAVANGGNGGYTYVLVQDPSNLTGQTDGSFENLGPGNYSIQVTDAGGCVTTSALVNVAQPAVVTASALVTGAITCNGASDGQITISGTGGTGAYTFAQVSPAGPSNATGIFSGLPQGTFDFTVTDLNGCSDLVQITLNQPALLTAIAAVTSNYNGSQISCNGLSDGVITVTASGGSGVLRYTFDQFALTNTTGQFSGVFTGVPAGGPYTFTIRDANNCVITTAPVTVTQPVAVTAMGAVTSDFNGEDISCVGATDGVITITASGGTGAFSYRLDQVPANTSGNASGIYTGVGAGTYTVTVRDVNSCFVVTTPITVAPPAALAISATVTSNYNGRQISCSGVSDGEITATASGGVPAYNYLLVEIPGNTTGATNGIFTGVPAGTYTVRVTDLNGCQQTTAPITISQPAVLTASAVITSNFNGQQLSCAGASDGRIQVTASGGTTAYSFVLVEIPANISGASSGIFTGVPAGTYTVSVTDVNSCNVLTAPVTITAPPAITAAAVVTSNYNGAQISCNGLNDGVITVTATGGTGVLRYTFDQFALTNTTGQFSGVFTGVPAGTGYTFTIRDANNCTLTTAPINVVEPTAVTATGVVTSNFNGQDISCVGATDGVITVTANGGTGTYTYRLDQLPLNTSGNTSGIYTGLGAGTYTVTVRDVNSCFVVTAPITIDPPPALTATAAITSNYNGRQISCNGASDGEITVTAGGGVPAYSYALIEIPLNTTGATSGVFAGVPAGTYTIRVTDLNGCQRVTAPVTIVQPAVLAASATVINNYNGQALSCVGASDAEIRVTATGGTPAYTYSFVEIPGNTSGATSGTFTGIPAGTYTFNVTDVNSCSVTTVAVTVSPPAAITGSAAVTSNYNGSQLSCNGASDGIITVTASGGTGLLQYAFDQFPGNTTGQFSGVFTGIPAGTGYTFTVRDANNCTFVTAPVNIVPPTIVTATVTVTSNYNGQEITCVGASDGEITVAGSGGTGTYTYRLDQVPLNVSGATTGVFVGLPAGSYTATVRDVNGCFVVTSPIIIDAPPVLTATIAVTSNYNGRQISCNGASDGQLTVTAGGGVPAYSYELIQIPANTSGATSGIFDGVPAGTYTVRVTDLNNCTRVTTPITIAEPAVLAATASVSALYLGEELSCVGASDGQIVVNATGGTTAYSFVLFEAPATPTGNITGASSGTFTSVPAGTYVIQVTDVNNCTVTTVPVTVDPPDALSVTAVVESSFNGFNISCNGLSDGQIRVTSAGGTGAVTYAFVQNPGNLTGRFSGIFTGIAAGTGYTFTVTDGNGCTTTTTAVDVTQPPALSATAAATSSFAGGFNIRCRNENNGQLTVTALGGNPNAPLNYILIEDAGNTTGATSGVFSNLRAGSYRVRVTDVNNCTVTTTPVVLTQPNDLAIAIQITSNFNGEDISCDNASDGSLGLVSPVTGGAGPYTFVLNQDPANPTNTTGDTNGSYTGLVEGLYSVTVTDANGCTRTSLPVFLLDPLPLFSGIVGLDRGYCIGEDPVPLTELAGAFGGIGNYTYQWEESPDNGTFADVPGATSATFDPPAITSTTYYRRKVFSGTCAVQTSNTVEIRINPLPTGTFTVSKSPVCEGDFFLLNFEFGGTAPFTFQYTLNDGINPVSTVTRIGAANTPIPVVNYREETTFTLTQVTDFNGCIVNPNLAITVPIRRIDTNFSITSPVAQCTGSTFSFSWRVDQDVQYTWSWPDGDEVIAPNTLPLGINTITHVVDFPTNTSTDQSLPVTLTAINNVSGCGPLTTSKPITIFRTVTPNIILDRDVICSGETVTVQNSTQGASQHDWFIFDPVSNTQTDARSTASAASQTFTINNTTTDNPREFVIVYNSRNANCVAPEIRRSVFVYRSVTADFTFPTPPEFTNQQSVVTFTNNSNPVDNADFQYSWDFGLDSDQTNSQNDNPGPITTTFIRNPGPRTVRLVVENRLNDRCRSEVAKDILIPVGLIEAEFTINPLRDCFPARIQVTSIRIRGDVTDRAWTVRNVNTGQTIGTSSALQPEFEIITPGTFEVFLTVRNSFTGQAFETPVQQVTIYPKPVATFQARPEVLFVPDTELSTFNFSTGATNYVWEFGDGGTSTEDRPKYFYRVEGLYTITLIAESDNGGGVICRDTATTQITARQGGITKIPNAFTPSPDGPGSGGVGGNGTFNDVFLPIVRGVEEFNMQIYDRWGNLVFESIDANRGWDGYDKNGRLMPAGVYVYKLVLRLSDGQRTTQVGDVTMIR